MEIASVDGAEKHYIQSQPRHETAHTTRAISAALFEHDFYLFCKIAKNRHIANKNSNDRISSMCAPFGVVEGQCDRPCGCLNSSLASLARLFEHDFDLFFKIAKNRHIAKTIFERP